LHGPHLSPADWPPPPRAWPRPDEDARLQALRRAPADRPAGPPRAAQRQPAPRAVSRRLGADEVTSREAWPAW